MLNLRRPGSPRRVLEDNAVYDDRYGAVVEYADADILQRAVVHRIQEYQGELVIRQGCLASYLVVMQDHVGQLATRWRVQIGLIGAENGRERPACREARAPYVAPLVDSLQGVSVTVAVGEYAIDRDAIRRRQV